MKARDPMAEQLDLMTTEEVAAEHRMPAATVRFWRATGKGPRGVRVGRRVLYPRSEVLAYFEALAAEQRDASRSPLPGKTRFMRLDL